MATKIGQGNDVIVWQRDGAVMVRPLTPEAEQWVEDNVGGELHYLGDSFYVEPRYIEQLVDGMRSAGLVVS